MENISILIGKKIRLYRLSLRLSQEALAERSDLHPTYIGSVERGEKNMSILTMYKIAKGLNISIEKLLFNREVNETTESESNSKIYSLINQQPDEVKEEIFHILKSIIRLRQR